VRYFLLGDQSAVLGFSMVGVEGLEIRKVKEAVEQFRKVLEDQSIGIILITERVAELIRQEIDQYQFHHQFPLIVEIPDRMGPMEGRAGIREMVNRAIGINL